MNMHRLPLFECRYICDGRIYTCRVRAASAEEAGEKLQQLDWAPGCGPVEAPFRVFEGDVAVESAVSSAVNLAAATATVFSEIRGHAEAAADVVAEPFYLRGREHH
jgi:hypothetical protein